MYQIVLRVLTKNELALRREKRCVLFVSLDLLKSLDELNILCQHELPLQFREDDSQHVIDGVIIQLCRIIITIILQLVCYFTPTTDMLLSHHYQDRVYPFSIGIEPTSQIQLELAEKGGVNLRHLLWY